MVKVSRTLMAQRSAGKFGRSHCGRYSPNECWRNMDSYPRGLYQYFAESKSFKHFSEKNGLPTTLIRAIADGEDGRLWLTTNKGVFLYNPDTQNVLATALQTCRQNPTQVEELKRVEKLSYDSQRGIEYFKYNQGKLTPLAQK